MTGAGHPRKFSPEFTQLGESLFTAGCAFLGQEAPTGFRLLADYLEYGAQLVPGSVCGKDPACEFESNFELAGRRSMQASRSNFRALLDCSHFDIGLCHIWDISFCIKNVAFKPSTSKKQRH